MTHIQTFQHTLCDTYTRTIDEHSCVLAVPSFIAVREMQSISIRKSLQHQSNSEKNENDLFLSLFLISESKESVSQTSILSRQNGDHTCPSLFPHEWLITCTCLPHFSWKPGTSYDMHAHIHTQQIRGMEKVVSCNWINSHICRVFPFILITTNDSSWNLSSGSGMRENGTNGITS